VVNTTRVQPPNMDGSTKRVAIEDSNPTPIGGDAWGGSWGSSWGTSWTSVVSVVAAAFPAIKRITEAAVGTITARVSSSAADIKTKRINTGSLNANNTPRIDLPEDPVVTPAAVVYAPRMGAVGEFSIGQGIPVGP
jgi:hypothetical protein